MKPLSTFWKLKRRTVPLRRWLQRRRKLLTHGASCLSSPTFLAVTFMRKFLIPSGNPTLLTPHRTGWLHVAIVKRPYKQRELLAGQATSSRIDIGLVLDAFHMSIRRQKSNLSLILHPACDIQYAPRALELHSLMRVLISS